MDLVSEEVVKLEAGDAGARERFRVRAQARGLFSAAVLQGPTASILIVEATRRCNLRCRHCFFGYGGKEELTLDFFDTITAQTNLSELVISGGEPLLHQEIMPLIELSLARAPKVSLVTNGTVQHPQALRKLAGGGATLVVSFDGAGARTHNYLRGTGVFDLAIGTALRYRAMSPNLELSFTCNRINRHELAHMLELACSLGAAKINFRPVYAPAGSPWESISLDQAAYNRAWFELVDLAVTHRQKMQYKNITLMFDNVRFGRRPICGAGKHIFFLQADCSLSPCRYMSKTHSLRMDPAAAARVINGTEAFTSRPVPEAAGACRVCIWRAICAGGCLAQSRAVAGAGGYCYKEIYRYILHKTIANEVV